MDEEEDEGGNGEERSIKIHWAEKHRAGSLQKTGAFEFKNYSHCTALEQ